MRALLCVVLLGGCGGSLRVKEARAIQKNPLFALASVDELAVSEKLYIHQHYPSTVGGAARFGRPPLLRSWAQFSVASRDRLRFHVGITRLYDDEADTRHWRAWLEDDHGRRLQPAAREVPHLDRYAAWGTSELSPYVGRADFVFYRRDLITRDSRGVTLALQRGDEVYRYKWEFDGGTLVQHYGYSKLDEEMHAPVIPRPQAEPLSTQYEDGLW